jgi:muramoyltetrapeptide carboxypeptidase LdcA involved in peptidoglycan recycling
MPKNIRLIRPSAMPLTDAVARDVASYLSKHFDVSVTYGEEITTFADAKQRALLIKLYLDSEMYDILWAVQGGEGCADIVTHLRQVDEGGRGAWRGLIIGSSDITALLVYFSQNTSVVCVHGPNARRLMQSEMPISLKFLVFALGLDGGDVEFQNLVPLNSTAKNPGEFTISKTVGGNLSLLAISIKDVWEFDGVGKLLIIEDWKERPHAIDRLLKYLSRIGKLDGVAAVLIGDMEEYLHRCIQRWANNLLIPVFATKLLGHGAENIPIPFNRTVHVTTGDIPQLRFSNPNKPS